MGAAGCGALPDALQHRQLADAADQRRSRAAVVGAKPLGQPHLDRRLLALRDHGLRLTVRDHLVCAAVRLASDEHAARRRRRLQAGGRVDDVARDHRLAHLGPCADGHQRLAGVDRDAHLRAQSGSHRQGRAHRALGVVAVGGGRAEHADHGVADELLDHAAERFDLVADTVVVRREMARTSSGSSVSAREVNPTRSTKMTVTIRRSSRDGAFAPASGRPHARQYWAIGGFSWPHEAQRVMTRVTARSFRRPSLSGPGVGERGPAPTNR